MITPVSPTEPYAPLKGVEILIMDAKTVDETVSNVICPSPGIKNHTVTLKTSAGVTGAAQIETSNDPTYAGTWSPLGGGPIDLATIAGGAAAGELQMQFSNITFTAIRVRISTVVAGGTLSASYLGN
jgi:hypothetical protein